MVWVFGIKSGGRSMGEKGEKKVRGREGGGEREGGGRGGGRRERGKMPLGHVNKDSLFILSLPLCPLPSLSLLPLMTSRTSQIIAPLHPPPLSFLSCSFPPSTLPPASLPQSPSEPSSHRSSCCQGRAEEEGREEREVVRRIEAGLL